MKTKIGQIRSKLTPLVPNRPPGGTPFVTGRRRRAHARPSPRTERAYDAGPKEGERGPGLFAAGIIRAIGGELLRLLWSPAPSTQVRNLLRHKNSLDLRRAAMRVWVFQ